VRQSSSTGISPLSLPVRGGRHLLGGGRRVAFAAGCGARGSARARAAPARRPGPRSGDLGVGRPPRSGRRSGDLGVGRPSPGPRAPRVARAPQIGLSERW